MAWYVAAALCGGLALFGMLAAQAWLPYLSRPEPVIVTALAGLVAGMAVGLVEQEWTAALRPILLFGFICVVTVVNLSTHLIPTALVIAGLAMAVPGFYHQPEQITPSLVASATCGLGLLVLENLRAEGEVEKGTVQLGAVVGLLMGWPAGPLALLLYLFFGAVSGLVQIWSGRLPTEVPVLALQAPAVLIQWFITHGGWMAPSLQIMLMAFGLGAFYLANRLIGTR